MLKYAASSLAWGVWGRAWTTYFSTWTTYVAVQGSGAAAWETRTTNPTYSKDPFMKHSLLAIVLIVAALSASAPRAHAHAQGGWTVTNLHPAGAFQSWAYGTSGTQQVGSAVVVGVDRASLWSGTAGSWEDLSLVLPGSWGHSYARSIWNDGSNTYVAGYGNDNAIGRRGEALLWTRSNTPCRADFNADGTLNPDGLADYITAFFVGC